MTERVAELEQELTKARDATREASRAAATPPPPKTYRVAKGDNLSAIAAKVYGDAGRWQEIANANRDLLRGSTTVIEGQKLVIPGPVGKPSTTSH